MSSPPTSPPGPPQPPPAPTAILPPDSHTAQRLRHATPEHLHQTSLRTFIGPIPEGWLKSHRKQWYKNYLPIVRSDSSRQPTFIAAQPRVDGAGEEGVRGRSGGLVRREEGHHGDEGQAGEQRAQDEGEGEVRMSSQSNLIAAANNENTASDTSLLHSQRAGTSNSFPHSNRIPPPVREETSTLSTRPSHGLLFDTAQPPARPPRRVRFSEPSRLQLRARAQRLAARGGLRSRAIRDGELMKMDKMLVRIDVTQATLPEDFDERASQGVEAKTLDKWREFMVVCRKHSEGDAVAVLQLYQTRVIAASLGEGENTKKKPKAQVLLSQRKARVNLYSSLDKTLCLWTSEGARTTIYYLRPASGAAAVEWYTFLSTILGWKRAQTLTVSVPDLSVSLRLEDPFQAMEASNVLDDAANGDEEALAKAMSDESWAARVIVKRCLDMLKQSPEWAEVLDSWARYDKVGLAWKRYDRLEWVHGAVEQRMYGTIAMQRTHDLELRPKDHYPLHTRRLAEKDDMDEPPPIEGFLIRLTSQKGQDRRLGKMLYKRLYFSSQDNHLLFLRPAKATPPPPPKIRPHADGVPSAHQIAQDVPLKYDVDPYPLSPTPCLHISWLDAATTPPHEIDQHDKDAAFEAQRNTDALLAADGFIDLTKVRAVREMTHGALPVDSNIDPTGPDVDFELPGPARDDSRLADGATSEVDEDRIFELVLANGLVVRLQAYNKLARAHWITRLRTLASYWRARCKADTDLYKSVREANLSALQIDERAEAVVGSFAHKWEVSQSYASSVLYNMCGLAACRSIHLAGTLFRKPRRRATFSRVRVLLVRGHLLVFEESLRKRSGKQIVAVHHERIASIDLRGCYIYSGLLTEQDLLYQNRTFDSNTPGRHALPRIYLEDGWTSADEDAMTCFVVWCSTRKSWFRSSETVDDVKESERRGAAGGAMGGSGGEGEKSRLKRVSQLGQKGRSVVFKARSRAERDHWVLGVGNEIERLSGFGGEGGEEVRLEE